MSQLQRAEAQREKQKQGNIEGEAWVSQKEVKNGVRKIDRNEDRETVEWREGGR